MPSGGRGSLPAGDAALTRRAKRASRLAAVVVRFGRVRRRHERRGVLVEPAALERAEEQCLSDEEARARIRDDVDLLLDGWRRPAQRPRS